MKMCTYKINKHVQELVFGHVTIALSINYTNRMNLRKKLICDKDTVYLQTKNNTN